MAVNSNPFSGQEIWFITGSQHLYGDAILQKVKDHSRIVVNELERASGIPVKIIYKALLTTPDEIVAVIREANASTSCIGLIAWMHTFSPAKMWINGLRVLSKPMLHLHTQFLQDIPWAEIDMDYMNLNQSAHGGREFGFINTRMGLNRKVVVGHFEDNEVQRKIGVWSRVASAVEWSSRMKVARFGDNMRSVAVTEGNKVSAQIKFGYEVSGYGLADLTDQIEAVEPSEVDQLVKIYAEEYAISSKLIKGGDRHESLKEAARIEIGLRSFLEQGGFEAFTDTFENLGSLRQLPGLPVQRLMAEGYGFGAEGDWKTAALLRTMKIMSWGLEGGMSFMEDYTYHFNPSQKLVLGAHMLEICPSIASSRPSCEIHPLGIGGKSDPVRLVFEGTSGVATNVSLIDLGHRFRLVVNEVEAVETKQDLPKLPVARVLWDPKPNLEQAATAWILAGGAHHTVFSQSINKEFMEDYAEMTDVEMVLIDEHTSLSRLKQDLRNNEIYFRS